MIHPNPERQGAAGVRGDGEMARQCWTLSLALIALTPAAWAAGTKRVYLIGNSLTDNVRYTGLQKLAESRGHKHIWGRHMIPGAPIWWLWQHPDQGFRQDPFGTYPKALGDYEWDAVTLQPFSMYSKEHEHARKFVGLATRKSPKVQFYIYAQWMTRDRDFDRYWLTTKLQKNKWGCGFKAHYETLVEELRQDFPDIKPVRLIPVGHAMFLLNQKMKAGLVPGYADIRQVYTDGIHLNNVGSYIVGCTFFATLYEETPVGLPVDGYTPEHTGDAPLDAKLARIIQETAWEVVATHPLTGVTCDLPVRVVTPILHEAIAGERYEMPLLAAFGRRPHRWTLGRGKLPPGLALSQDGAIAGTPEAAGAAQFEVQVTDAKGATARKALALTVAPDSKPTIVSDVLPPARRAELYRHPLRAEGGNRPLTWRPVRGARLPVGLHLQTDGTLVGSPPKEGTHELKVEVIDADLTDPETATKTVRLTVGPAERQVLVVRELDGQVKVDGKLDEPFWSLDKRVTKLVGGGPANNEATFDVAWNRGALYVAVKVKDAALKRDSKEPWHDDSVEIFIDALGNREKAYNADDRRIVIDVSGRMTVVGNSHHIRKAVQKTGDGYVVEMSIMWWNLRVKPYGKVIGFDVAVNDDDDGGDRDSRVVWRGTQDNETDPSQFGTLILEQKPDKKR